MNALDLVRTTLADYIDTSAEQIVPDAVLADLGVDSLTLAELIFDLENKHGIDIADNVVRPTTVADLMALITQYLESHQERAA